MVMHNDGAAISWRRMTAFLIPHRRPGRIRGIAAVVRGA